MNPKKLKDNKSDNNKKSDKDGIVIEEADDPGTRGDAHMLPTSNTSSSSLSSLKDLEEGEHSSTQS